MFGSKANTAKTVLKSKTGRKVAAQGAKGAFRFGRSDGGQAAGKAGAKGIGRLTRGAAKAKAGKEAGKVGSKNLAKAGRGVSKYAAKRGKKEIKIAEKNLNSGGSGSSRLLKFGLLVIAGLSIGALVGRLMSSQESQQDDSSSTGSSGQNDASSDSSGGSSGQSSTSEADLPRGHSDPSSGSLIGTDHNGDVEGVTEDQPELVQRIRTSIGEDERTKDMPRVNVEVNEGVAELRGNAPSEEAKEAAGEIAAEVEGISEVRNLIEVNS